MDAEHRGRDEERRRELIQRLLGPAVHRLNNSMAVVSGLTVLLQEQEPNHARRKQFESVSEQASEASALIRELGQLPQVRAVSADDAVEIDLEEVLARSATLIAPVCRTLRVEFEAPAPHAAATRRTVRAPATALTHQLTALAVEFLPRERLPSAGAVLCLRVRDAPGAVQVELGYRAPEAEETAEHTPRAEVVEEARRCAAAWGGELALCERGAERAVVWSLVACGAAEDGAELQASTAAARILVLERDAQLGTLIGDVLSDVGHDVEVLSDPGGLATAAEGTWDLVLFDSGSGPGAREVARGASTPVVRMCGHDTDVEPGEQVLLKPFRPQELIECVRTALGS